MQPMIDDGWVKQVVGTWGNHDWTTRFDRKDLPGWIRILVDEEAEYNGLRIWGSPWSNQFMKWAWMGQPEALKAHYDAIPKGVDILISHQPPSGICWYTDPNTGVKECIGSEELREAIGRVKPRVTVCGHIHSGYGEYMVAGCKVMNVACLDTQYKVVRGATEVLL